MNYSKASENTGSDVDFFTEISEHQISAREFFSCVLLDALDRNFHLQNALISYYDTKGDFLSWTSKNGVMIDSKTHPYRAYIDKDLIRHIIFQEAVKDRLTYFNIEPRLYVATDILGKDQYDDSPHAQFLQDHFNMKYSLSMAFGINAYIQVTFFKTAEQGDFSEEEVLSLRKIYVYVANSYKNFKKHEQAKIVSNIQSEIIASGEKAYLVTDDFMHILSSNELAKVYLKDILGTSIEEDLSRESPCTWLPFLLGGQGQEQMEDSVQTRVIRNYVFKIYTYDQCYSNGIIDRYHWITISKIEEKEKQDHGRRDLPLTVTEHKVAELLYEGLTYKAIADSLVVSYHTVKKHVQNIYLKCEIQNRYQLFKLMDEENFDK